MDKEIENLVKAVTDYGYNDEYGYYDDWADKVRPIIETAVVSIVEKAKQEERERVVKAMTGEYKIIKESYSNELNDFGYNERVREEIEKARTLLT